MPAPMRSITAVLTALACLILAAPSARAGLPPAADWTRAADGAFDQFAYSVAALGDVNGDGYSDFAFGAPFWDPPGSGTGDAGGVYAYFGSATGAPASLAPSWKGWNGLFAGNFGWSVGGAGDVNGDGYDDMIVGQPANGASTQKAYVYLGAPGAVGFRRPNNTVSAGDWKCAGAGAWNGNSQFGWSVTGVGDMNNDGYDEVAVGQPNWSDNAGAPNRGAFYVWKGRSDFGDAGLGTSDDGTLANANHAEFSGTANRQFGWSVAGAGDVNADGFADMVVGSPGDNNRTGKVNLYLGGNGLNIANAADIIPGYASGSNYGASVATAGDVNGDGFSDVIVGGPGYNGGRGGVWLYLGRSTAPYLQLWASWQGDAVGDSLGMSVHTAGDINGDGYADIVVGAGSFVNINVAYLGKAKVWYSKPWGMSATADWSAVGQADGINQGAGFGHSVCAAGDVNGDGFGDLLVGSRKFGNSEWGKGYLYYGSGNTPNANNPYTAFGSEQYAEFGTSVAVGDFDQDGWGDVVAGAPLAAGTAFDQGELRMFRGGPFGPATSPTSNYIFPFALGGIELGRSICFAGDLDGDGFNDVVAGGPGYGGFGAIIIYYGNASGQFYDGVRNLVLLAGAQQAGERYGHSVASAGDVNGDGYADLLVGAPMYDGPAGADAGRVYLYLGSPAGIVTSQAPAAIFEGAQFGEQYGFAVSSAGDVDRDGRSDIVIGAPYYDKPLGRFSIFDAGRFEVHRGVVGGVSPAVWSFGVGGGNDALGYSVAEAGDVNGDGLSDVIVGAPTNSTIAGAVFLQLSLASGGATSVPIASPQAGGDINGPRFGNTVAGAGDQNNDGYSDFYVGAPQYDGAYAFNEGRVMLYHGNAAGAFGQPNWVKDGGQTSVGWGSAIAAGDITGDGFPDMVAGAPLFDLYVADEGYIQTYLGNDGGIHREVIQRTLDFQYFIQPLGRTRYSTGFSLAGLGRSAAGRTKTKMDYECRAIVWGPALTVGSSGPYTDTGTGGLFYGSSVGLNGNINTLTGEMPFAWQARYRTRNRFFPTSPWQSPGTNGRRIWDLRTSPNPLAVEGATMPTALEFALPQPNPARGAVQLSFALPRAAQVEVEVLDLQGRVVRTVLRAARAAGPHTVAWDGADGKGHLAAPGVYFARVRAGGEAATRRIVRVQ